MYRLYPPYFAAMIFSMLVYACVGPAHYSGINRILHGPLDFLVHALMVHNLFERFPFSLGNGVFWTLALEEQLYALYALYVVLRKKHSAVKIALLSLVVTVLWRSLVVACATGSLGRAPLELGSWWTWPFGWWFCWIIGAVAAEAYVRVTALPSWCMSGRWCVGLAAAGLITSDAILGKLGWTHWVGSTFGRSKLWWVLFRLMPQFSELILAVSFFILINRLVASEAESGRASSLRRRAAALGRMSYSLYLTHSPIVIVFEAFLLSGLGAGATIVRYALLVPCCIGLGAVFFFGVESWFLLKKRAPTTLRA